MTPKMLEETRQWFDWELSMSIGTRAELVSAGIELLTYIDALRSQLAVVEKERDELKWRLEGLEK